MTKNQTRRSIGKASEASYLVSFIVTVFLFLIRMVAVLYRIAFPRKQAFNPATTMPRQTAATAKAIPEMAAFVSGKDADVHSQDFPDTVVAPQKADYEPSSRIHITNLEVAHGVQIGRVWFYLYPNTKVVRRVFRIEDAQLQQIFGDGKGGRQRFYMKDVAWDPATGEMGINTIEADTVREIKELVYDRACRRAGAKPMKSAKAASAEIKVAPQPQPKVPEPKPASPTLVATVKETESARPEVKQSVTRHATGDTYEGVIAEMGHTPRPARNGGGTYMSYCLKLDVNGVHKTFYGVELERELLERAAGAGDLIKLVSMGRQNLNEGDATKEAIWKNLYKVTVLKKG